MGRAGDLPADAHQTAGGCRVTSIGDRILAEVEDRRRSIAEEMPTEQDAIETMYRAYSRLRDLGWRDGLYMPKDGTPVTVIQIGSTGTFECRYSGKWADGYFNLYDGGDVYPSRSAPPLFKQPSSDERTLPGPEQVKA